MQDLFIEFLPPWVETGLQPAFYDRESGTVLQQTARMYAKVNELVKAVNGMDKIIKEYVDYIDNYFKNLDVQEEINNKLEEMADSGELAEFIAQYANLPCVHAYATIADMASSENLADGSYARAMSKTVAGTGDGFYYYIRTKTGADTPDGENLVAIGDDLVAVKIPDYALNALATAIDARCDAIEEDIAELQTPTKKYLFVGDSYAEGYTPDGNVTGWPNIIKSKLSIPDSQYTSIYRGGMGFSREPEYNFYTLINSQSNDNELTDIIIGGGFNDVGASYSDINTGIYNVYTLCKSKFPNAKLHIAFIGWSKNGSSKSSLIFTYHRYNSACNNVAEVDFMQNTQYALHDYFNMFASDGFHPNENGQTAIANAVCDALLYGSANISFTSEFHFTGPSSITGGDLNCFVNNNVTTLWASASIELTWNSGSYVTIDGYNECEIGTITSGSIYGTIGNGISTTVPVVLKIDTAESTAPFANEYVTVPLEIVIRNGKIYLQGKLVSTAGTSYGKYVVKVAQIPSFSITTNTIVA